MNAFSPQLALATLAQAPANHDTTRVVVWVGVLIAIMIVGGVGILMLRRRLLSKESESAASTGLLDTLRAMRDRGEISPEEFDKARQAMVAKLAGRGSVANTAGSTVSTMPGGPASG